MTNLSPHLRIEEISLAPTEEWECRASRCRFVWISHGEVYWRNGSSARALTGGELIALKQLGGTIRASQLSAAQIQTFTFDPELLCGFFTLNERALLDQTWSPAQSEPVLFPSTHPVSQAMGLLMQARPRMHEVVVRGELLVLALKVMAGTLPSVSRPPELSNSAQLRFRQLLCDMPDTELLQHPPEELARLCGCTTRHFNRLFRTVFGQSPRTKQTELRLLKARTLLETSQESVREIAMACGFRAPAQLVSLFKRRFGINPRDWRKPAAANAVANLKDGMV